MYRSFLFVPANDEKRIARVHERGADVVILDLEDAVAAVDKDHARKGVRAIAAGLHSRGARVFVRINSSWRAALADLEASIGADVAGVIASKVNGAAQARVVAEMVREVELARDLEAGVTQLIALVETSAGVLDAAAIAAVRGITGLALGSEDLSVELGVAPSAASLDLPCKQIALAAASRGLMALGAPVSIAEFRDLDAYAAAMDSARAVGMTGVFCIHPAQVEIANARFAPSKSELADARAILAVWDAAQANGQAVVSLNGRMIDAPVVKRALRLVGRG